MRFFQGCLMLILVSSSLLIGLANATSNKGTTSPPFVSPFGKEFNKEEIARRLINQGFQLRAHETAAILFMAKNKGTTELIDNVTVSDLLALNTINENDCTKEEFDRRSKICSDTTFYGSIRPYCRHCLALAATFCKERLTKLLQDTRETAEYVQKFIDGV